MLRHILAAMIATTALMGATAAHAGTHWSVGIGFNLPAAGVVVSDRYIAPAPVYVEPAPVYYAPAPVVEYVPPPPRYIHRDVYYAPAPRVIYETSYRDRRWDDRRDWHHDHDRRDGWDRGHDNYGPHRGR